MSGIEPNVYALAMDLVAPETPKRPTITEALSHAQPGDVVPACDGHRLVAVAVLADGSAYTVSDTCPHDGGLLSNGFIDGNRLVCMRHGWELDLRAGTCSHVSQLRIPTQRIS